MPSKNQEMNHGRVQQKLYVDGKKQLIDREALFVSVVDITSTSFLFYILYSCLDGCLYNRCVIM